MKRLVPLLLALLILGAACTPAQREGLQTLAAAVPPAQDAAPLGGQVGALPVPAATETPAGSLFAFPTETPTPARPIAGPLATLTAVAAMLPTQDTSSPPYVVELRGRPHFIEFHAWW